MRLSKSQKVYVCVLGLGAVALLADRVFFGAGAGAPEAAGARPMRSPHRSAKPPGESPLPLQADAPGPLVREDTLADRVRAVAEANKLHLVDVRDAFCPSQALIGQLQKAGPTGSQQSKAEAFKQRHRLTGVMAGKADGYAIVDGACVLIGQELEGFKLLSVGERSAVFQSKDASQVELKLEGQPQRGASE